mmetsp:Transcript_15574/g.33767  ORF Transcript_15574/g.33767 Transcript_15574/m.33767 type:complete len:108 (-) Transcript_15574:261-584(-)|eukprot:CAMPEP_0118922502 /NCGR_PEP_ID=MMETSP1169-20130426/1408_1 /TAXON_ID=36882 /ORGANISM="Pyramimonas obovata, Strain CCMP722" /LENGTH=107 /DNA_ID=CAMNT_0006863387 /DNA_START=198 /DNA_END=521 /DNA_ORIENTATION=+
MSAASKLPARLYSLKLLLSNRCCTANVVRIADGQVVASASSAEEQFKEVLKSKSDMIAAAKVGELMAARLKEANIPAVNFQKPVGKPFHGKLACIINTLRESGIVYN